MEKNTIQVSTIWMPFWRLATAFALPELLKNVGKIKAEEADAIDIDEIERIVKRLKDKEGNSKA